MTKWDRRHSEGIENAALCGHALPAQPLGSARTVLSCRRATCTCARGSPWERLVQTPAGRTPCLYYTGNARVSRRQGNRFLETLALILSRKTFFLLLLQPDPPCHRNALPPHRPGRLAALRKIQESAGSSRANDPQATNAASSLACFRRRRLDDGDRATMPFGLNQKIPRLQN